MLILCCWPVCQSTYNTEPTTALLSWPSHVSSISSAAATTTTLFSPSLFFAIYRLYLSLARCCWICSAAFHSCVRTPLVSIYAPPLPLSLPGARKRKIDRPPKRKKEKKDEERGPQRRLPEPSRRRNRSRLLTTLATLSVSLSLSFLGPPLSRHVFIVAVWSATPQLEKKIPTSTIASWLSGRDVSHLDVDGWALGDALGCKQAEPGRQPLS